MATAQDLLDSPDTLAAWVYGDLVTGGVAPYFDLPSTGSDLQGRSGRGYAAGRFRGEKLVYAEAEYRGTLTRVSLDVGFGRQGSRGIYLALQEAF